MFIGKDVTINNLERLRIKCCKKQKKKKKLQLAD